MTEKHHNPPLLVVGHLTLMFISNVDGDGYMSFLIQWHISDRRAFSRLHNLVKYMTTDFVASVLP